MMKHRFSFKQTLVMFAGIAMFALMPSVFAVAQEASADKEAVDLVILRPFTSKPNKSYNIGEDGRLLKVIIAVNSNRRFMVDSKIKTQLAIGVAEEEEAIENRLCIKDEKSKGGYKDLQERINMNELRAFAKERNTKLVLLSDIFIMGARSHEEKTINKDYSITYHNYDIQMYYLLYDARTDKFLHSKLYRTELDTSLVPYYDRCKKLMFSFKEIYKISTTQTISISDKEFDKSTDDFMATDIGAMFKAIFMPSFIEIAPKVYNALGIKSDDETGGKRRAMVITSAPTGFDVRVFRYDLGTKNIDGTFIAGQVSSTDPKLSLDGMEITAGDFDGDGKDELAVSTGFDIGDSKSPQHFQKYNGSVVYVYKYENGKFDMTAPLTELRDSLDEKKTGAYVAAGDFDGDGKDELAVSQCRWYDKVKIFRFKDGAFDTSDPVAVISKAFNSEDGFDNGVYVTAADIDGDGKDELVMAKTINNDHVKAFKINSGAATQVLDAKDMFGDYASSVAIAGGDFDGDGKDELALSALGRPDVRAYSVTGGNLDATKPFATLTNKYYGAYPYGFFIGAGDVDGDGHDDLLVSTTALNNDVRVFRYDNSEFNTQIGDMTGNYVGYFMGVYVATGRF